MSNHEPREAPTPALKPLALLDTLEGLKGLEGLEGAVCDIDDPDCVVPEASPAGERAEDRDSGERRAASDVGARD